MLRTLLSSIAVLAALPASAGTMFTALGTFSGGLWSEARAISADGTTVVGVATGDRDGESYSEAFRWTESEGLVRLGNLGGQLSSEAYGVSGDGSVVVGRGSAPGNVREAFRWTSGTGMVGLGTLPASTPGSGAQAISGDGSVVVGSSVTDAGAEATAWTLESGIVSLGYLPGGDVSAVALAVSWDGSVIVGSSSIAGGGEEPFRWTAADGLVGLGNLGGAPFGVAAGVSGDGAIIVGDSVDPFVGQSTGFRWTAETGMVSLGIPGDRADWQYSYATAISADGRTIVGYTADYAHGDLAFVWTASEGMRLLDDILAEAGVDLGGFELVRATGVSADGRRIVGTGFNPAGEREAWLVDVPEPGAGLLLVATGVAWLVAGWASPGHGAGAAHES